MSTPFVRLSRAAFLALFLLVPPLAAQQVLNTKAGDSFEGTVVSDDGKTVTFRTAEGMEMKIPYADLDAASVHHLMAARTAKTDGPGQVLVGDQAAAAGLFVAAREAYSLALQADSSLGPAVDGKLASLRVAASNALLAQAKQDMAEKRPDVAAHTLATLMHEFPAEAAAKEGAAMLDTLHASQSAARSQAKAATLSQEVQQALAPTEAKYNEAAKKITKGLQSTKNQSASIDEFNGAIELDKSARQSLKDQQARAAAIAGLADAMKQLDQELVDQMVNAYTQLANVYNQRTSYNDATNAVNAGLALQPDNSQLLALRDQISSNAAQTGGVIGWGYGRERR